MTRTIVTAANWKYCAKLRFLLRSANIFEPRTRVIVFNLGLGPGQLESLRKCNEVRNFDFSKWPSWMHVDNEKGHYAWKAQILESLLPELDGLLLWLDAASMILGPINEFWTLVHAQGFVAPTSSGTLRDWTHPQTLEQIRVPAEDLWRQNRKSGVVGFNLELPWVHGMIHEWAAHSRHKSTIAPEGSSRLNHRQDQAVLSCMFYQYQRVHGFESPEHVTNIRSHLKKFSDETCEQLLRDRLS